MISDLRESGAIEQDADTVMFIDRPDYHPDKNENNTPSAPPNQEELSASEVIGQKVEQAYIYLAKNRHGRQGKDPVWWIPSKTLFYEPGEKDPLEPGSPFAKNKDEASQNYDFEEEAEESEVPLTEEDEMQQAQEAEPDPDESFLADAHYDYPEGFMSE